MTKTTSLISMLLLSFALVVAADETKDPEGSGKDQSTETAKSDKPATVSESPLVKAARQGKAKREEGEKSRISINNDDVEKSVGKLIQSTTKPLEPLPAKPDLEKARRDVAEAAAKKPKATDVRAKVDEHQKDVKDLEQELRRIEETYYNEDDPDFREDVLARKFDETKAQLEAARKALAEARKAMSDDPGSN